MLSSLWNSVLETVLERKEHTAHWMAVSAMPDHKKYFMQALYNSYLIIIASFFLVFTLCWSSPLVKIYVGFTENLKLVLWGHLQHVRRKKSVVASMQYFASWSFSTYSQMNVIMQLECWKYMKAKTHFIFKALSRVTQQVTEDFGLILSQISRSNVISSSFPCAVCFVLPHFAGY